MTFKKTERFRRRITKSDALLQRSSSFCDAKVVIVGASNSAVDAALEIWRKGGDVTMVVRGPKIGESVKYWLKPDIENRIKEGSIKAYFNSEIEKLQKTKFL